MSFDIDCIFRLKIKKLIVRTTRSPFFDRRPRPSDVDKYFILCTHTILSDGATNRKSNIINITSLPTT